MGLTIYMDDRGWSYHDIFGELKGGQINFSIVYPGIVKAWHRHRYQTDYFFVLFGEAQVATYDPKTSKTETYFIGEHNPVVLKIPAGLWHGFTPLGGKPCGLLYYMTRRYNPKKPDEERAPWDAFGYDWSPKSR
mgnify:CR=1 FL=1